MYTLLSLSSSRLESPLARPPTENIIRLTGRGQWPGKRESLDWSKMVSSPKTTGFALLKEKTQPMKLKQH